MRVLVADIGGTNARFGLVSRVDGHLRLDTEATLPSRRFTSLGDALSQFLEQTPEATSAERACFGLAGPIRANRCETTNLPWVVDGEEMAGVLGLAEAWLLNDLEAAAWGLSVVRANGVRTLHDGSPAASGNRALLAPGTGLGEAALFWDGERHHPFATEGGHTDFGPADELQVELWRYLNRHHGHVSWERVCSGPGLVAIFRFFVEYRGQEEPEWLQRELSAGDAAATISRHATGEPCPLCSDTLDLFFSLLGAEAGNLALRTLATGGVYLAGGIIPKLLSELMDSSFLSAFTAKGRFGPLLESIPVRVVIDDRLALWGAAVRAMQPARG